MSTQRVVSFELDDSARAQVHARLGAARAERARQACGARRSALLNRARELGADLAAAVPDLASTTVASVVEAARSNAELAEKVVVLEAAREAARSAEAQRVAADADVDGVLRGLAPGVPVPPELTALLDRLRTASADRRRMLRASARGAVADANAAAAVRTTQRRSTAVALEELAARAAGLEDTGVTCLVQDAQRRHDSRADVDPAAIAAAVELAERAQERAAGQRYARETLLAELVNAGVELEESSGTRLAHDGRLVTVRARAARADVGARMSFDDRTLHWHATRLDTPDAQPPGPQEALRAEQTLCDLLDRALDGAARAGVLSNPVKSVPPDGATAVARPSAAAPDARPTSRKTTPSTTAAKRRREQQRREQQRRELG